MKISDIDLNSIKFHNTSFREYIGVYDNYIIASYPFALIMYSIFDHCDYDALKLERNEIERIHISDHSLINPSHVYTSISGILVGNTGKLNDDHLMNLDLSDNIIELNSDILSTKRDNKLNSLLNSL